MKPGKQQFQTQQHQHILFLKDELCILYTHVRNIIVLAVKILLKTRMIWDYLFFVEIEGVLIHLDYVSLISYTHKLYIYIYIKNIYSFRYINVCGR